MKSLFFTLAFAHAFSNLFSPSFSSAGQEVGNGGDAVFCKPSSANSFNGYYSLDYLSFFSPDAQIVPAETVDQSLSRIEKLLTQKLPTLAQDFKSFRADVFNQTNLGRPHIWEVAPFGLIDLKDEALVTLLPENCRSGDKVNIVQAVIRQPPQVSGLPPTKLLFKFVPQVVNDLKANNPVQLSYLIVHEWLWSFSDNVQRNRRITNWLHSNQLETLTAAQLVANFEAIGFAIPGSQPPVWSKEVCNLDTDRVKEILNKRGLNVHIFPLFTGTGEAFKRRYECAKTGHCVPKNVKDETSQFRSSIGGKLSLFGWIGNFLAAVHVTANTPDGIYNPDKNINGLCDITRVGVSQEDIGCRKVNNVDFNTEFQLTMTIGKNCLTQRGFRLTDKGTYNEIEEIVYYFPSVTWGF